VQKVRNKGFSDGSTKPTASGEKNDFEDITINLSGNVIETGMFEAKK